MRYPYLDIINLSNQGPQITKEQWDFDFVTMTTRQLVKKYQLGWQKDQIICNDENLADRVFQAGLELASQLGAYCLSTKRRLIFDKKDLEWGLANMPQTIVLGEGNDARTLYARGILDTRAPIVWAGNPGAPTPEELFLPYVMSCMQEPIVDLITCGSLTHINGHEVRAGEPTEVIATRRELQYLREALKRVGRPGMGMLAAQSSVTELGDLAVSQPSYLRPCDAHLVPMLNELMIDSGSMTRVVNSLDYGMKNASLACVMVGGLAGDAPGSAIVQVASFILANLICSADYHLLHPIHIRHVATTTRSVLWVQSIVAQAFARNAPCIIVADIYPKSGAMTYELLYEVAANAIVVAVSGAHLEGVGAADGAAPNGSGLEARLMGEIGHAVTKQGIDLQQANTLVLKLLEKYEHVFSLPGGNPGIRFDQAYHLDDLTPVPEWLKMYEDVKNDLRRMGLTL